LIVVDEEHETAYKEDGSPHHDARRVAEIRAEMSGARLIFGSATPSLEAFYRAQQGELTLLELPTRALDQPLPHVVISDLRRLYREGKPSILGDDLRAALEETLARSEQAILFLNRRAYASSLLCRECGFVPMCPYCSVSLTVHKQARRLRCHHCNLQERIPDVCPRCGSPRLRPLGIGTERVVEAVESEFEGCRVARLDRDVVRKAGAVEEVLHRLQEGDLDVLVGTQMVAKGLHFPRVTLVGVVTADTSLFIPDFRSTERTFQLITQVCGRSGRARPGMAVIQTFQPEHPAIALGAKQDYVRFYERELAERRDALYPPFCRLVNIVVSSEDRASAERTAFEAADLLRRHLTRVLGPAACAFERLKGRWRYHVLVKLDLGDDADLARLPDELLARRNVRVTVDVDPVSVL
jgi:primosomal protein N' (replication factor Y)